MTCYMTCGTQTEGKPNQLLVIKMSNLTKMNEDSKWLSLIRAGLNNMFNFF